MIPSVRRIFVVPSLVVDGNLHFLRIPVIQAIRAPVILRAVKVLRVIDVGIVVKPIPVDRTVTPAPRTAISMLL
jgi:hypothetical protein